MFIQQGNRRQFEQTREDPRYIYLGASKVAGAIGVPLYPEDERDLIWAAHMRVDGEAKPRKINEYAQKAIQNGIELEPEARAKFMKLFGLNVIQTGMHRCWDLPIVGAFPDGLIEGQNAGVELKVLWRRALPEFEDAIPLAWIVQSIVGAVCCRCDKWYLFIYKPWDFPYWVCYSIEEFDCAWSFIYKGIKDYEHHLKTGTKPQRVKKTGRANINTAIRKGCRITPLYSSSSSELFGDLFTLPDDFEPDPVTA